MSYASLKSSFLLYGNRFLLYSGGMGRPHLGHEKVSVSLPSDLLQAIRRQANRSGMSLSQAMAEVLRRGLRDPGDQVTSDRSEEW